MNTTLTLAGVPAWLAGADHEAALRAADQVFRAHDISPSAAHAAVDAELAGGDVDAAALAAWNAAERAACAALGDEDRFTRLELVGADVPMQEPPAVRAKRLVHDDITCWKFSRLINGRIIGVSHCYSADQAHREFGGRRHIARAIRTIRARMRALTSEILQ